MPFYSSVGRRAISFMLDFLNWIVESRIPNPAVSDYTAGNTALGLRAMIVLFSLCLVLMLNRR